MSDDSLTMNAREAAKDYKNDMQSCLWDYGELITALTDRIEALQAGMDAAVLAEREACAALCDVVTQDHIGDIVRGIGDEIRARSEKDT